MYAYLSCFRNVLIKKEEVKMNLERETQANLKDRGRGYFLVLIFTYMSYLYILELNPSSISSFANIFSLSKGCLSVLFTVSFAGQ